MGPMVTAMRWNAGCRLADLIIGRELNGLCYSGLEDGTEAMTIAARQPSVVIADTQDNPAVAATRITGTLRALVACGADAALD